jgi:hypothetical protein
MEKLVVLTNLVDFSKEEIQIVIVLRDREAMETIYTIIRWGVHRALENLSLGESSIQKLVVGLIYIFACNEIKL